jgi:hypothetical protein
MKVRKCETCAAVVHGDGPNGAYDHMNLHMKIETLERLVGTLCNMQGIDPTDLFAASPVIISEVEL